MASSKLNIVLEARDRASKSMKKFNNSLEKTKISLGKLKMAALGVGLSFGALAIFAKKAVEAYGIEERAIARLTAGLKNVKGMTDENVDSLKEYAAEMQRITTFGDEQVISGMAMLSTFQLNENAIKALTPRLLDMTAALEKSTGTQQEMESVAIAVGKAMTLGVGSLTRYGVVISDTAKKAFLLADAEEKVNIITQELDKNFKGIAETVAKTASGRLIQFKNIMSDLQEDIGAGIIPVLTDLTTLIGGSATQFGQLNNTAYETFRVFSFVYESGAEVIRMLSQLSLGIEATINRFKAFLITKFGLNKQFEEGAKALEELDKALEQIGATSLEVDKQAADLHLRMLRRGEELRDELGKTTGANKAALDEMKEDIRDFRDTIDKERNKYIRALNEMIDARQDKVDKMGELIAQELQLGKAADQEYIASIRQNIKTEIDEMYKAQKILLDLEKAKTILTVSEIQKRFTAKLKESDIGIPLAELPEITIPTFQKGGIVPGPVGEPVPAIVHGGEKVIPTDGDSAGGNTFNFDFAGAYIGDIDAFKRQIINLINRDSELRALGGV